jgi:hypothetical protein
MRTVLQLCLLITLFFGLGLEQARAFPTTGLKPVICEYGKGGRFTTAKEFSIYKLHTDVEEYKYFDENCDGVIDKNERRKIDAYLTREVRAGAEAEFARYAENNVVVPAPPQKVAPPPKVGGWASQFILRDSFEDISIFSSPQDIKQASGASFSYARDNVAFNTAWSAKGVAAYPISWSAPPIEGRRPEYQPYLVGFAVTPSFSFQRVSNSNANVAARSDVNILSYGAGGEVAIGHLFDNTTTHYFRLRGAAVSNFDSQLRSTNAVAEYQPLTNWKSIPNLSTPNPLGFLPATYEVDLIFRTHYAERSGNVAISDPLFVDGNSVLRTGAVVGLSVLPLQGDDSPVPAWLQKANFNASYSWLDDVRTGRKYEHLMASLGYTFDEAGHIAMKASYERGRIEETAQKVEITKVGLTVRY